MLKYSPGATPVYCACGRVMYGRGLGDVIATWLQAIGVTPGNWSEWRVCGGMVAVLVRVPPPERKCGCTKRRLAINDIGNRLKQAFNNAAAAAKGWTAGNTTVDPQDKSKENGS